MRSVINSSSPPRHSLRSLGFTQRDFTLKAGGATPGVGSSGVVDFTGYGNFSDTWSYVIGTANLGTILGAGGLALDSSEFAGRIYSAAFTLSGQGPVTY